MKTILFIYNFFQRFFSIFPNKKISPIYVNHITDFSSKALTFFSSKSAIKKIVYKCANFVPIGVPRTCQKVFSSNSKMLFFSTISVSSIRVSLEICFLSPNSKSLRTDVSRPRTSIVHRIAPCGNVPKLFNLLKKWLVSLINDLTF